MDVGGIEGMIVFNEKQNTSARDMTTLEQTTVRKPDQPRVASGVYSL